MPRLVSYEAGQGKLQPSETGVEAFQRAGRVEGEMARSTGEGLGNTVSRIGDQIGKRIDQHQEFMEISSGSLAHAKLDASLMDQYNAALATADPNDHTFGQRFYEQTVQPALEKSMDGYHTEGGERFALGYFNRSAQTWQERINADSMKRAADAVSSNWTNTTNTMASTLYHNYDQHTLDSSLDQLGLLADGTVQGAGLSGPEAAKFKTEGVSKARTLMISTAVQGAALAGDVKQARVLLNDPKYAGFLGDKLPELTKQVDAIDRMNQEQARADDVDHQRQEQEGANAAANDLFAQVAKNGGAIPPDYYKNLGTAAARFKTVDPGLWRSMANFGQEQTKRLAEGTPDVTDPKVYSDFAQRVFDPQHPLTQQEVFTARAQHKLSEKDYTLFNGELDKMAKDPQGTADEKSMLHQATIQAENQISTAFSGTGTPDVKTLRFTSWFLPQYQAMRKAGKTPEQLLSPDSPDYMLKPDVIARFKTATGDTVAQPGILARVVGAVTGGSDKPAAPAASAAVDPNRKAQLDAILFGKK